MGWGAYPYWGSDYPYYGYPYDGAYYGRPAYYGSAADDLAVDVQRELKRRGYYRGGIDGQIGGGTRSALRNFQAEHRLAVTGRIDLVHANDSRDEFGSGADRHTSFGRGHVDHDAFVEVIRAAGAPVIAETPGGPEEHGADFAWLRERL